MSPRAEQLVSETAIDESRRGVDDVIRSKGNRSDREFALGSNDVDILGIDAVNI